MKSFYDIIEIDETASFEDVKKAYFRFLRKEHPDKNPEHANTELLNTVGQIWEQFKENRPSYDSWLREQKLRETQGTIGETIELDFGELEIDEICRCGADFDLTAEKLEQIIDVGIFECSSCSLCLEVRRPAH
uniref:J domain-containing protein n=1 Tax=Caenorhabditis japonica TaxID=281687 RepID=A0A8R1IKQ4_CAEJA